MGSGRAEVGSTDSAVRDLAAHWVEAVSRDPVDARILRETRKRPNYIVAETEAERVGGGGA